MACYRYIELNPVRAQMVEHPADYRWSSYRVNAGIQTRRQLIPHECYQRLGASDRERFTVYRDLFLVDLGKDLVQDINRALEFSMPLGGSRFQQQIEQALGRSLGQAYRGRPKKAVEND